MIRAARSVRVIISAATPGKTSNTTSRPGRLVTNAAMKSRPLTASRSAKATWPRPRPPCTAPASRGKTPPPTSPSLSRAAPRATDHRPLTNLLNEQNTFPEPPFFRRFRRGRRLALPGAARNHIVLVSDLARATRRARAQRQAARLPAAQHRYPAVPRRSQQLRPRHRPHQHAVAEERLQGRRVDQAK